jgi:hypothetical protein
MFDLKRSCEASLWALLSRNLKLDLLSAGHHPSRRSQRMKNKWSKQRMWQPNNLKLDLPVFQFSPSLVLFLKPRNTKRYPSLHLRPSLLDTTPSVTFLPIQSLRQLPSQTLNPVLDLIYWLP